MIKYESLCVDCDYCIGYSCPYKREVPVHYCDECGEELPSDEIYEVDGEELCKHCVLDKFRKR